MYVEIENNDYAYFNDFKIKNILHLLYFNLNWFLQFAFPTNLISFYFIFFFASIQCKNKNEQICINRNIFQ